MNSAYTGLICLLSGLLLGCQSTSITSFSEQSLDSDKREISVLAFSLSLSEIEKAGGDNVSFRFECQNESSQTTYKLEHKILPFTPASPGKRKVELALFSLPPGSYFCKNPHLYLPSNTRGSSSFSARSYAADNFNFDRLQQKIVLKPGGFLHVAKVSLGITFQYKQRRLVNAETLLRYYSPWSESNLSDVVVPIAKQFSVAEAIVYENNDKKNENLVILPLDLNKEVKSFK